MTAINNYSKAPKVTLEEFEMAYSHASQNGKTLGDRHLEFAINRYGAEDAQLMQELLSKNAYRK